MLDHRDTLHLKTPFPGEHIFLSSTVEFNFFE